MNLEPKVNNYDNRFAHSREGSKVMGCVQPGMHISLCRKEGEYKWQWVLSKYDVKFLRI